VPGDGGSGSLEALSGAEASPEGEPERRSAVRSVVWGLVDGLPGRNGRVGAVLRGSAPSPWLIGSGDFGRVGARSGAEVLVAQAVGVALEGEELGVVDEPVDHRHGGRLVAEDLAPRH
jgi:hypothetical protein